MEYCEYISYNFLHFLRLGCSVITLERLSDANQEGARLFQGLWNMTAINSNTVPAVGNTWHDGHPIETMVWIWIYLFLAPIVEVKLFMFLNSLLFVLILIQYLKVLLNKSFKIRN